jgi:hypothetical protein
MVFSALMVEGPLGRAIRMVICDMLSAVLVALEGTATERANFMKEIIDGECVLSEDLFKGFGVTCSLSVFSRCVAHSYLVCDL